MLDQEDGATALPVCRTNFDMTYFSHEVKFTPGMARRECPAAISSDLGGEMQATALRLHHSLGCSGLSRTDFGLGQDLTVTVFEINTLPGLLPTSIFPAQCAAAGLSYEQMVATLLRDAVTPRPMEIPKIRSGLT